MPLYTATLAEHDTTHWCQNGRPTQELAGDVPRTVTDETLVMCNDGTGDQANESEDVWWLRPDGKTQVIYEADNEQDEARRRSQHRRFSSPHSHNGQERFAGVTTSDELLQMIEKMPEKPDKERTTPQRVHDSDGGEETTGTPTRVRIITKARVQRNPR